ncbi:MAG: class I SAM-dependent methyltransferase [Myxococcaceae bacterium]|nr:class I SAM-dependent methyltransferase [Myxococcaceae bacterium]
MNLPRLQLFEFNDAPFAPRVLQRTIVSALSRALRWGHLLDGLVEPFRQFLEASGAKEVLEVAAGAGEPATLLLEALSAQGHLPPTFTLTDLHPHVEAWRALVERHPTKLAFVPAPVDATRLPDDLGRGRARVIINAFHHFPPALAQQVLVGMARGGPGVFLAEGLVRDPRSFLAMTPWGLPALLAEPLLASEGRLSSAALTWLSPVAVLASMWDGTVSTLRCYSRDELFRFAGAVGPDWRWEYGTYPVGRFGQGSWFWGAPRKQPAQPPR